MRVTARRGVVLLAVALAAGASGTACHGRAAPRYVPRLQQHELPQTEASRTELADRIVAEQPADLDALARARQALAQALEAHPSAPFALSWRMARLCFLAARRLENTTQRVDSAREGVRQARAAVKARRDRVEGHYYLALNLAQIAEAESRLSLVRPMVEAAERAAAIDPTFDQAGPLVFLGKVYLTAPAWPVSLGNVEKAIARLERALRVAPRPLTRIFLGQAYYEDDREREAREQLERALREAGPGDLEPRWRTEAEKTLRKLEP